MKKTQKIQKLTDRIKELYVTYRGVWIEQKPDGTYHTERKIKFHDDRITDHLMQKKTVGLTVQEVTKFITFDIDYGKKNMRQANKAVESLIDELTENHGIGLENILVSFSGSKGYHLEIFFDTPVKVSIAKSWHNKVVQAIGSTTDKIEFRPSKQGIKLPLGIHKVTGKKCYLVHPLTLEELPDEYIFNVVQLDGSRFIDDAIQWLGEQQEEKVIYLEQEKAEEFKEVLETTNLNIPIDYEERCLMMLEENKLLYPESRHHSTLLLLIFLSQNGYDEETAVSIVKKVIGNTFVVARDFIGEGTTLEFALSEVERLWKYASKYTLGQERKTTVRLYEDEVLKTLEPKEMHLKRLLFILLIHSKKYAKSDGIFYMTYKQMAEYGADTKNSRLLKYLLTLQEKGLIEIVERSRKNGLHYLPNKYKVNISHKAERYIELDLTKNINIKDDFSKIVAELIPKKVAQSLIEKSQFSREFAKSYKALTQAV